MLRLVLAAVLCAVSMASGAAFAAGPNPPVCGHVAAITTYPDNHPIAREITLRVCHMGPYNPPAIAIAVTKEKMSTDQSVGAILEHIAHLPPGHSAFVCIDAVSVGDLANLHLEFVAFDDKDFAGNPVTIESKCPPPTHDGNDK